MQKNLEKNKKSVLYLDACFFVSYFYKGKNADLEKHKTVKKCLDIFSNFKNITLCTSYWTVTELVRVLVNTKKMKRNTVAEIEADLINTGRLGNNKIKFIPVSNLEDYDFKEFFYNVRCGLLSYRSSVGDVIHGVIMQNNKLDTIVTFDLKNDFKQIPGLTVIDPEDIANI